MRETLIQYCARLETELAAARKEYEIEHAEHMKTVDVAQAALKAKEEAERDVARLDKLQDMTKGYGKGWILRNSTRGRGMRLHETDQDGAWPTVRAAIDAAIDEERKP